MSCLPEKQPSEHIQILLRKHNEEIIAAIAPPALSSANSENKAPNKPSSSRMSQTSESPEKVARTVSPRKASLARLKGTPGSSKTLEAPSKKDGIRSQRNSVSKFNSIDKSRPQSVKKPLMAESLTQSTPPAQPPTKEPPLTDIKALGFRTQVFSGLNYVIRVEIESKEYSVVIWEKSKSGSSQLNSVTPI